MKRRVLVVLFLSLIALPVFSETKSLNFDLVLNKEDDTFMQFFDEPVDFNYLPSPIERIDDLVATNNNPVERTFYVGYEIHNDIFDLDTTDEKFEIYLTFSASGNEENKNDYMLSYQGVSGGGLVFDYRIDSTNYTFDTSVRDEMASLSQRQVMLFRRGDNDITPIKKSHAVTITINPPQVEIKNDDGTTTTDFAFTAGQYVGYVILSMKAI